MNIASRRLKSQNWVAVQKPRALKQAEIKRLIKDSYEMAPEKLPKKTLARLG